jgi:hypothetical protein
MNISDTDLAGPGNFFADVAGPGTFKLGESGSGMNISYRYRFDRARNI